MPTGAGFAVLNPLGESACITDMGANRLVNARFVDDWESKLAASDVVATLLEIPLDGAVRAMELAKKHRARAILNPAPARPLDGHVLKAVDVLTPNETELRVLLGLAPDHPAPTLDLARELHRRTAGAVIVTLGARGALLLRDGHEIERPGIPVDVVDTTGAGDAFNAGLAVALAEGRDLVEAVELANSTGAMACTAIGCIPGLPDHGTVEQLREHYYGRSSARERSV
jgi:ribokinase